MLWKLTVWKDKGRVEIWEKLYGKLSIIALTWEDHFGNDLSPNRGHTFMPKIEGFEKTCVSGHMLNPYEKKGYVRVSFCGFKALPNSVTVVFVSGFGLVSHTVLVLSHFYSCILQL